MNINVVKVDINDVILYDGVKYNTNNKYILNNEKQPDDYLDNINRCNTKNWIDLFHQNNYKIFDINSNDLKWMNEALQIGSYTRKFPNYYLDELNDSVKKYNNFPNGKYFIRSERVSLKYGIHGCGPYFNIKDIIESIVTTRDTHKCFTNIDENCRLYLMEWKDINKDKEFRCFVYNNNLTCISLQHIYEVNDWLNNKDDEFIKMIATKINEFFTNNIKNKLSFLNTYTFDIVFLDNNELYFIEPNSYGKNYAAGSALFEWSLDENKLKDNNIIEIRITKK